MLNPADVQTRFYKLYPDLETLNHQYNSTTYNPLYYESRKDDVLKQQKTWREKNHAQWIKSQRASRSKPQSKELASIRKHNYRASLHAGGSHTVEQWRMIQSHYDFRCAYCGRKSKHLTKDHVVPISKGGTNDYVNIVPACMKCNQSKASKLIPPTILPLWDITSPDRVRIYSPNQLQAVSQLATLE